MFRIVDLAAASRWICPALPRWGAALRIDDSFTRIDPRSPGAAPNAYYAHHPVAEWLCVRFERAVRTALGRVVHAAYGQVRVVVRGEHVRPHCDTNDVSDWTLSTNVSPAQVADWPLVVEDADGREHRCDTSAGRGVVLPGRSYRHWRPGPCPVDRSVGLVLRYCDRPQPRRLDRYAVRDAKAELYAHRAGISVVRGLFDASELVSIEQTCRYGSTEQPGTVVGSPHPVPEIRDCWVRRVDRKRHNEPTPYGGRGAAWFFDLLDEAVAGLADSVRPGCSPKALTAERGQFTVYAAGGHYDWHIDAMGRVLSAVLLMQPATTGGRLEFREASTPDLAAGDVVVFDSQTTHHRVTPVIAGERRSLVVWYHGAASSRARSRSAVA